MEKTLVLLKPGALQRRLMGKILTRIEERGFIVCGLKMMQLNVEILSEHYAHLTDKPFFPDIVASMTATPVVALCLKGVDAVRTFRQMTGVTNGRNAEPGTLRGDFCLSGSENVVHASDSPENAEIEIKRFFRPEELFDWTPADIQFMYGPQER